MGGPRGGNSPVAVLLLMFVGLPWPFAAVVAAILLLPLMIPHRGGSLASPSSRRLSW